jgi:hypothetical protein
MKVKELRLKLAQVSEEHDEAEVVIDGNDGSYREVSVVDVIYAEKGTKYDPRKGGMRTYFGDYTDDAGMALGATRVAVLYIDEG